MIWVAGFILSLTIEGSSGLVIDINSTSAEIQCRQPVILRCYSSNIFYVQWQIAKSVISNTTLSAECFVVHGCNIFENFNGRYSYDYDSSTGISELSISYVKSEDEEREYKCNDQSSQPFKPVVKNTPDSSNFKLRNTSIGNNYDFIFESICTTKDIYIKWFSTADNLTDLAIYNASNFYTVPCNDSNCTSVNTTSTLKLEKVSRRKRADGRSFAVNVSYDSVTLHFPIPGSYKLKDTFAGGSGTDVSSDGTPRLIGIAIGSIAAGTVVVSVVVSIILTSVKNKGKRKNRAVSVPDTPTEFALVKESVTETTAKFQCKPGLYPQKGQTICLRCQPTLNKDKSGVVVKRKLAVGGDNVQIKIKGLMKGCHYRCFVSSEFNNRSSDLSSEIELQTLGNPHTPLEVEQKRVTSSSIEVSWAPGKYHRHIQTFVIEYTNLENNDMKQEEKFDDGNEKMKKTINNLQPKTKYSIVIFAKNEIGESERSKPLVVKTLGKNRQLST